jgi:hypothetical protein
MNNDREFWLAIRAALLLFVDAIEQRYKVGKHAGNQMQRISNSDNETVVMPH